MNKLHLAGSLLALVAPLLATTARAASYALSIHETPARIAARTDPQTAPAYWHAFAAFGDELKIAGVLRGGSAFDASAPAKSVKAGQADASAPLATAPSAPVFGGYFIIEVATEAEALAWAARAPNPGGHIEVRTLLPMMAK